jgi:hypothetical protein
MAGCAQWMNEQDNQWKATSEQQRTTFNQKPFFKVNVSQIRPKITARFATFTDFSILSGNPT